MKKEFTYESVEIVLQELFGKELTKYLLMVAETYHDDPYWIKTMEWIFDPSNGFLTELQSDIVWLRLIKGYEYLKIRDCITIPLRSTDKIRLKYYSAMRFLQSSKIKDIIVKQGLYYDYCTYDEIQKGGL